LGWNSGPSQKGTQGQWGDYPASRGSGAVSPPRTAGRDREAIAEGGETLVKTRGRGTSPSHATSPREHDVHDPTRNEV